MWIIYLLGWAILLLAAHAASECWSRPCRGLSCMCAFVENKTFDSTCVSRNLLTLDFFPFFFWFFRVFSKRLNSSYFRPVEKLLPNKANFRKTPIFKNSWIWKKPLFLSLLFLERKVTSLRENALVFRCSCLCTAVKVTWLTEISSIHRSLFLMRPWGSIFRF